MKNLNSFKMVALALEYEIQRQQNVLASGKEVSQETRLWNEEAGITQPMRGKEEAYDYRYFPEPDLPPLFISEEEIKNVEKTLPELPNKRKERFIAEYKLTDYEATILISSKDVAEFFEECEGLDMVCLDLFLATAFDAPIPIPPKNRNPPFPVFLSPSDSFVFRPQVCEFPVVFGDLLFDFTDFSAILSNVSSPAS